MNFLKNTKYIGFITVFLLFIFVFAINVTAWVGPTEDAPPTGDTSITPLNTGGDSAFEDRQIKAGSVTSEDQIIAAEFCFADDDRNCINEWPEDGDMGSGNNVPPVWTHKENTYNIFYNGNVGIGTTSLDRELTVDGTMVSSKYIDSENPEYYIDTDGDSLFNELYTHYLHSDLFVDRGSQRSYKVDPDKVSIFKTISLGGEERDEWFKMPICESGSELISTGDGWECILPGECQVVWEPSAQADEICDGDTVTQSNSCNSTTRIIEGTKDCSCGPWVPNANTECIGTPVPQTNSCNETQTVDGTKTGIDCEELDIKFLVDGDNDWESGIPTDILVSGVPSLDAYPATTCTWGPWREGVPINCDGENDPWPTRIAGIGIAREVMSFQINYPPRTRPDLFFSGASDAYCRGNVLWFKWKGLKSNKDANPWVQDDTPVYCDTPDLSRLVFKVNTKNNNYSQWKTGQPPTIEVSGIHGGKFSKDEGGVDCTWAGRAITCDGAQLSVPTNKSGEGQVLATAKFTATNKYGTTQITGATKAYCVGDIVWLQWLGFETDTKKFTPDSEPVVCSVAKTAPDLTNLRFSIYDDLGANKWTGSPNTININVSGITSDSALTSCYIQGISGGAKIPIKCNGTQSSLPTGNSKNAAERSLLIFGATNSDGLTSTKIGATGASCVNGVVQFEWKGFNNSWTANSTSVTCAPPEPVAKSCPSGDCTGTNNIINATGPYRILSGTCIGAWDVDISEYYKNDPTSKGHAWCTTGWENPKWSLNPENATTDRITLWSNKVYSGINNIVYTGDQDNNDCVATCYGAWETNGYSNSVADFPTYSSSSCNTGWVDISCD